MKRVVHRMDWGVTPQTRKRYAMCSCGWRAPARSKLTHGMSDVRDHLAAIRAQCRAQGWRWEMVSREGLVTLEPEPGDDQVADVEPTRDTPTRISTDVRLA